MKYNTLKNFLFIAAFICCRQLVQAQAKMATDTINISKKEKENVLYGQQDYNRFVGNMSVVKGDELRTYPAMMVQEALAGRLPGFFSLQNDGNPGEDNFTSYVRGSVGGYITLIDGIERPLNPYDIEQIEEIRLLKDPVSKALYGGRVSNGILIVTTKRGKNISKSEFHASIQKGIKMPTVLPKYLNSYDFASYYNQALANDKITTGVYSQSALDAYKNHNNPYLYPDVDFYGQFLDKSMDLTRISTEYYGGNESTKFYVHGGYQKEGGFEKYASKPRQMQAFNLQGNVDSKFSDQIILHANFAAYMANKQYPGELGGPILGTLATRYPNAYPILVAPDSAGGTSSFKDNPYAQQRQRGYTQENHLRMQTDLSFDFKLDKLVKGLTFKPGYSFDIFHKQNLQKLNTVGIYSIAGFTLDGTPNAFNVLQVPAKATTQTLGDDDYERRWGFTGVLSYEKTFGRNAVNADVVYFITKDVYAGNFQDYKRQNLGLKVNYTYNEKYTLEGVVDYSGSQSYIVNRRFKTFPAFGAGWLISKEGFMKHVSFVDFLKLNASWGIMGDGNIAVNQWRETWSRVNGNYSFNTSAVGSTAQLDQVASNTLNWPTQQETDISLEAKLLKSVGFKFSYFSYLQADLLSKKANVTPLILGGSNFLPQVNYGKTSLKGIEAELSYSGKTGKLGYQIGTHFTYSKSKKVVIDELQDPNYSTKGTPWDAIWGYQANGTYTQADITSIQAGTSTLPKPSYMDPKALRVGNIKYKDLNGDGVIDKYDTKIIGNNAPRMLFAANIKLNYKGFDLFAQFVGYGQYNSLLNSSYYQINSTRKYSRVLIDGLPNGNPHPPLTTGTGTNDFQVSDYWIVNNSFLKLQNVALSYTLPKSILSRLRAGDVKLFLYGTDLLTLSKIKKSDPESLTAGLANYPLFKTYAAGVTVTF